MKLPFILLGSLLTTTFAASGQITAFEDDFTGGSTVNSATPLAPTVTSTSYEIISSKTYTPNPPTIDSGLQFGIATTGGGGGEAQALFSATPVTFSTAGDYIQLTVTFTNISGLLTQRGQFGIGMFNSSGFLPWSGGLNGTADNKSDHNEAAIGAAQNWVGYLALTDWTDDNKHSRIFTRLPQTGPDNWNRNQVTAVPGNLSSIYGYSNPREAGVNSSSAVPNLGMTEGAVYTDVLTLTLQEDGSIQIINDIYEDNPAGTLLSTQTANTGTTPLTNSFDAFSIGFRSAGNTSPTVIDISSIKVVKFIQSEATCISAAFKNAASMVEGQTNGSVDINIPLNATSGGPLSVSLISTNPAAAYPGGAPGGTLTVTFPQDSPYNTTNIPITVASTGSTFFYLSNATASACISDQAFSSPVDVVCGTVSLTPSILALQTGQADQFVTVELTTGMNQSGPVSVTINNSDPSVATLQTYTVTFPQGGQDSTNIIVNALAAGNTTLTLTDLVSSGCGILSTSLVTVACDPITISPATLISLVGQTSQILTVSIPAYANQSGAVTVDLKSLNPSVVVPQGSVGDTLSLTFPAGGTNKLLVSLNVLTPGMATLVLTNNDSAVGCSSLLNNSTVAITVPVTNPTTTKIEGFDSEVSAAANGWVEYLSRDNGENYGFSLTGFAGGSEGEAGGNFIRYTDRSYYADTNIGGLTLNDHISASGTLAINPPSQNAAFTIGFFNTADPAGNRNILGIGLADGSFPHQRISATVGLSTTTFRETFGPSQLFPPEINTWSFIYDPTAGATGSGRLTLTYTANGSEWTAEIDLTAADRMAGANFNAFGMLVRATSGLDTENQMGIYMDDLTYTKGSPIVTIPTSIPLQLTADGTHLTLTWGNPEFSLGFATNVAGPYIKIPEAVSPFETNATGATGFFRLVWP